MDLLPKHIVQPDHGIPDITGQRCADGSIVLNITRSCLGHTAKESLVVVETRYDGWLYIIAAAKAVQCCPAAPQGDLRSQLFKSGNYISKEEREITDGLQCLPLEVLSLPTETPSESKDDKLMAVLLSGLVGLLKGGRDFSKAVTTFAYGIEREPSLLALCYNEASKGTDIFKIIVILKKEQKKYRKQAKYIEWIIFLLSSALVYHETAGKSISGDLKRRHARTIWRLIQLLSTVGRPGLLFIAAFGYMNNRLDIIGSTSEADWQEMKESLSEKLTILTQWLSYQFNGSPIGSNKVIVVNVLSFIMDYYENQKAPVNYAALLEKFMASNWKDARTETVEEKPVSYFFSDASMTRPPKEAPDLFQIGSRENVKGFMDDVASISRRCEEVVNAAHEPVPPRIEAPATSGRYDPVHDEEASPPPQAAPAFGEDSASSGDANIASSSQGRLGGHSLTATAPARFSFPPLAPPNTSVYTDALADIANPDGYRQQEYSETGLSNIRSQDLSHLPPPHRARGGGSALDTGFPSRLAPQLGRENGHEEQQAADQPFAHQTFESLNMLANVASLPGVPPDDTDSAYGSSAMSSQFWETPRAGEPKRPLPESSHDGRPAKKQIPASSAPSQPPNVPDWQGTDALFDQLMDDLEYFQAWDYVPPEFSFDYPQPTEDAEPNFPINGNAGDLGIDTSTTFAPLDGQQDPNQGN